jgi:hypothetical protein
MMEPDNSKSATTPETQLNSPVAVPSQANAQANTGTLSQDTGAGTDHNSDRDSHLPGNSNAAASSGSESPETQGITAGADSTLIHGPGVMLPGTVAGGADMSAAAAPKTSTSAASGSPTASAAPTVAEDNPRVGPAQPISISVSSGNDQKVEIRLMERAGEILVSVRTPDQTLAHSLRDDLGTLTGKLNQSGYSTEAFASPGSASSKLSDHGADRGGDKHGASDDRESDGGQRQNSGQRGHGDEQESRQEGRGKRPAWLEELNHSMASRQPNRSK